MRSAGMNLFLRHLGMLVLILVQGLSNIGSAQTRPVSPADCVKVKYITGLWLSATGTRVAYLVKAPNIEHNRNDYQLYVKNIADASASPGRLLVQGVDISDVQWFDSDRHVAMLMSLDGAKSLTIVNVATGKQEPTFRTSNAMRSYSIDAAGDTVAYIVEDPRTQADVPGSSPTHVASGYRVTFGAKISDGDSTMSVYVRHRDRNGVWLQPQAVNAENPITHIAATHLIYPRRLSLAPDGKRLFFAYASPQLPDEWKQNPFVKYLETVNPLREIMVFYDLRTKRTILALKTAIAYSDPLWSGDSRSLYVNAHSPVGSRWETDDISARRISPKDVNIFEIRPDSGEVAEVLSHVPPKYDEEGALFVRPDGDVIARTSDTRIVRFHRVDGSWAEIAHMDLPKKDGDQFEYVAANGTDIIGVHETVTTPEDLFSFTLGHNHIRSLTDLNPELKNLRLAAVKTIHWKTSQGMNVSGQLFMPPDYISRKRYPLVIQTKGNSGLFSCDSGLNLYPSFAPQPMATAGIMYLIRSFDDTWDLQQETALQPPGYPGNISEAVQQMDIWDSAVKTLDAQGLIDPLKVGIIGFSRTGWQVEFDLVHARTNYAAATAADNVQYSLSDYWLYPSIRDDSEGIYGGPPYGQTLDNWKK